MEYLKINWPEDMPMRLLGRLRDCEQLAVGCISLGLEVEGARLREALEVLSDVWMASELSDLADALVGSLNELLDVLSAWEPSEQGEAHP